MSAGSKLCCALADTAKMPVTVTVTRKQRSSSPFAPVESFLLAKVNIGERGRCGDIDQVITDLCLPTAGFNLKFRVDSNPVTARRCPAGGLAVTRNSRVPGHRQ